MRPSATLALKPGVWFRRGRLLIVSPDSLGTACPLSGRNSTYRLVQILEAGSCNAACGPRSPISLLAPRVCDRGARTGADLTPIRLLV
jgi:hypothetical protein